MPTDAIRCISCAVSSTLTWQTGHGPCWLLSGRRIRGPNSSAGGPRSDFGDFHLFLQPERPRCTGMIRNSKITPNGNGDGDDRVENKQPLPSFQPRLSIHSCI